MQIKRIEIDGDAGTLTIERDRRNPNTERAATIRIDSIVANPRRGEQAWKTWELPARASEDELFKLAEVVQERTDGVRGTNSMIHDYFTQMQLFTN